MLSSYKQGQRMSDVQKRLEEGSFIIKQQTVKLRSKVTGFLVLYISM